MLCRTKRKLTDVGTDDVALRYRVTTAPQMGIPSSYIALRAFLTLSGKYLRAFSIRFFMSM